MVEYKIDPSDQSRQEEQLSLLFKTLADPTRRRIIELLREADVLTVTDIAQAFDMSLNGVSKHLKNLEKAGLVKRHVDGREHRIQINWAALQMPYEWLHFYQHFWSGRLDALVNYVQNKKEEKS